MVDWVLALSYWLHLVATVVWIGGLVLLAVAVWPQMVTRDRAILDLFAKLRKRFYPLANLSLLVLIVTGLYQMTKNKNYNGFLQINNGWAWAILIKHIVVLGMIIVGGIMQWGVLPALDRATLRVQLGKDAPDLEQLQRRERQLTVISCVLGIITLICTAIATTVV